MIGRDGRDLPFGRIMIVEGECYGMISGVGMHGTAETHHAQGLGGLCAEGRDATRRQLISLKAGSTNPSGPLVHAVESAANNGRQER